MDSGRHASDHKPSIFRRFLSFLIMVAVVVVGAWLLRSFVIEPFQIPSASMEDTIKTGDMVFAEKVSYHFSDPEQGDIVVFSDPQVPSRTLEAGLPLPAYDYVPKCSHAFNLLDARGVISATERMGYILRVRTIAKACCKAYLEKVVGQCVEDEEGE